MPVFFINAEQVKNGRVSVTGPLAAHLRGSLRLQAGEQIWLGDERRRRYLVEAVRIDRAAVQGRILEERTGPTAACPAVTLAPALLKGDRMEWLIQKATELGVASITPLVTRQTIIRPKTARLSAQEERWQRIALEAAQQSERWEVPTVAAPHEATGFFTAHPPNLLALILSERSSGTRLADLPLPTAQSGSGVVLAVGPEGGWAEEEARLAEERGFLPVTMGSRILRAETAALAALSILQSRLGELG